MKTYGGSREHGVEPTEDLQEGLLVDDRGLGRCLQEVHEITLALQEHDDFLQ